MKRTLIALTCLIALAAAGAASAAGGHRAKLQLRKTSLGKILVNRQGFTLYEFTKDRRNMDACVSVAGCTRVWPPLTTSGKAMAGAGVKASLIGTITLPGGVKQTTYAGHPLYTYVGDNGPGQTDYVGTPEFGGTWYAVNAAGHAVK